MTTTETNATPQAAPATQARTDGQFFAMPYNIEATGFYFDNMEQFEAGMAHAWKTQGVEEFELQCIAHEYPELFSAANVNQCNIGAYLDMLDTIEDYQRPALYYLMDYMGETLEEALQHLDNVMVTEGTAEDYAHEYIEDSGMLDALPEPLRYYFDYESFARDMMINGDVTEFEYDGDTFTAQGV